MHQQRQVRRAALKAQSQLQAPEQAAQLWAARLRTELLRAASSSEHTRIGRDTQQLQAPALSAAAAAAAELGAASHSSAINSISSHSHDEQ